jgi:hypothetical protein
MGPIEERVREEVKQDSALAEIAYKLAFTIDEGDGSVAMVKELRNSLRDLNVEKRWSPAVGRRSSIEDD